MTTQCPHRGARTGTKAATTGFTLLEVMVAVGILAMSLTSLLSSQMASLRATRYARDVTIASFLAEYQLVEVEWLMRKDGWIQDDKRYEGDFSDLGWPDIRYNCLVDFIKMPEFSQIQKAKQQADGTTDGYSGTYYRSAKDQAFTAMGMVWATVKLAIEQSIRKTSCTVKWRDGSLEHDFQVVTFWADPEKLKLLPQLGEEQTQKTEDTERQQKGGKESEGGGAKAPSTGGPSTSAPSGPGLAGTSFPMPGGGR